MQFPIFSFCPLHTHTHTKYSDHIIWEHIGTFSSLILTSYFFLIIIIFIGQIYTSRWNEIYGKKILFKKIPIDVKNKTVPHCAQFLRLKTFKNLIGLPHHKRLLFTWSKLSWLFNLTHLIGEYTRMKNVVTWHVKELL